MPSRTGIASLSVWTVISMLFAGGAVLCSGGWFIDYEILESILNSYSYTGHVEYFTESYYRGVLSRAQIIGMGLMLCAAGAAVMRNVCYNAVRAIWRARKTEYRQLTEWLFARSNQSNLSRCVFWCILLIGIMLRTIYYVNQDVHADEARTFTAYAFRPFLVIISDWTAPNNQILHTILVRLCYLAFGDGLLILRLPAYICGILFLPLAYQFGRKCFNYQVGILLMAYCSVNYGLLSYSVIGRGYSLLFCLTYILLLLVFFIAEYPENRLAWCLSVLSSALGLYTIPTMLYTVIGVSCWLLIQSARLNSACRSRIRKRMVVAYLAGTGIITTILYSPVFIATDWHLIQDDPTLTKPRTLANIMVSLPNWIENMKKLAVEPYPTWILAALVCIGVAGLVVNKEGRVTRNAIGLITAVIALSLVMPIGMQRVIPYARIYIIYFPLLTAILFYGLWQLVGLYSLAGKYQKVILYIFCAVLSLLPTIRLIRMYGPHVLPTGDQVQGIKKVTAFLDNEADVNDIIIAMCPVPGPMIYYLRTNGTPLYVYDLLQYIPIIEKGTNTIWLVASKEYGQSINNLKLQLEKLHEGPLTHYNAYESEFIEVAKIVGVEVGGSVLTGN